VGQVLAHRRTSTGVELASSQAASHERRIRISFRPPTLAWRNRPARHSRFRVWKGTCTSSAAARTVSHGSGSALNVDDVYARVWSASLCLLMSTSAPESVVVKRTCTDGLAAVGALTQPYTRVLS
jgi:hypothetical protein